MILGRAPHPRNVPPDARRLVRGGTEVDFLDESAISVGHNEANGRVRPEQGANGSCRKLRGHIQRMPLASVLQPHSQHEWQARLGGSGRQLPHGGASRLDVMEHGIDPQGNRAPGPGGLQISLPFGQSRLDCGYRPESRFTIAGIEEPRVAFHRIAPENRRQVRDPRAGDVGAIHRFDNCGGGGAWHLPPWVAADPGVDVDSHWAPGKLCAGKIRTALAWRTRSSSGCRSR